ncbi:MAG TPA: bifunctional YncE family protein/alkaline phosphatase family protein [Gemmatimonadales bacterium]|jgi:YVTN family beta-propeller protein
MRFHRLLPVLLGCLVACNSGHAPAALSLDGQHRLPTGATLDPVGTLADVGPYPFAMTDVPGGSHALLLLAGYRDNGIQVIETATGHAVQTIPLPDAFDGIAFDPAGRTIYAAGGDRDVVYILGWNGTSASLADSIVLAHHAARQSGTRYPGGLAVSRDGKTLYVAENTDDSLAVIDIPSRRVLQRLPAGRYPYAVAVAPDGSVYASAWGGFAVTHWHLDGQRLGPAATVRVARHPSALLMNHDGSRLFVASASTDRVSVIDTRSDAVVAELVDTIPRASGEGSTPDALALSPSGDRLFVAEADNNAVAVFGLGAATSGVSSAAGADHLVGRIPVGWYPSALAVHGDTLVVVNAKGRGTAPNGSNGPGPGAGPSRKPSETGYTLGQLTGTVSVIPLRGLDLAATSKRVAHANGWDREAERVAGYPPFEHVIYIIKENRTYDQVLGDLSQADGDTSLVFFGRNVTPNQHALAERFGVFDRFFVNAEVSADGHNWSTAAYTTDYLQKTVPLNYAGKGRSYDYEGENRGVRPPDGEDAAEPVNGYLWDLAKRRGITFRNFGEFVADRDNSALAAGYRGLKPFLESHTDSAFPGFDLAIPDQRRADEWLKNLAEWVRTGAMPALQIVRLPNDHTRGAAAGAFTPRAYAADNDLALGRMVEGLSTSPFWKNTVVFVLEDDAQNGPDHVDSHRSAMLIVSAYNQPRVWHRFGNTTDVIATIEQILSLDHLSQFDAYGRPYRGIFTARPDLSPYHVLTPGISLTERNPANTPAARMSAHLDFRLEDLVDDATLNHVLWAAIKGDRPYPGVHRMTADQVSR